MTKTLALLLDSYRELNAKRMFWVVLALSALVIGAMACLGNKAGALTILAWTTPVKAAFIWGKTPDTFYNWMYTHVGISIWLTWVATILALVSTASIFPDFMAGGSIDLYLSKPISRVRLFLTKYIGGLLFVTLQVTIFSFCSFLLLGIRGNSWEPRLFWSIPLVVAVFSYLFSICVLLGVLTRSTIASLLLTLLIWLAIAGAQFVEQSILLPIQIFSDAHAASLDHQIAQTQYELDHYSTSRPSTTQASPSDFSFRRKIPFGELFDGRSKSGLKDHLDQLKSERAQITGTIHTVHKVGYAVLTLLPKTQGATDLLKRQLKVDEPDDTNADNPPDFSDDAPRGGRPEEQQNYMANQIKKELDKRTPAWILGTSFAFEAVMVGLAGWIFCRRDY